MNRVLALIVGFLLVLSVARWCFGSNTPYTLEFFEGLGNEIDGRATLNELENYLEMFTNRWGAIDDPSARWRFAKSYMSQFGGGPELWQALLQQANNVWWARVLGFVISPFSTIFSFLAQCLFFIWTYISDFTAFSLVPAGLLVEYAIYLVRIVRYLIFA